MGGLLGLYGLTMAQQDSKAAPWTWRRRPTSVAIQERGVLYVLVDDGPADVWAYQFVGSRSHPTDRITAPGDPVSPQRSEQAAPG
jgi:hypothetical protein